MLDVLKTSWALLLGMLLLMVGNGLQGTLLGVRGGIEGFSTLQRSIVMSAYFAGFFGGSRLTPELFRRVGHVRVFAALGSFISAVLILFPVIAALERARRNAIHSQRVPLTPLDPSPIPSRQWKAAGSIPSLPPPTTTRSQGDPS